MYYLLSNYQTKKVAFPFLAIVLLIAASLACGGGTAAPTQVGRATNPPESIATAGQVEPTKPPEPTNTPKPTPVPPTPTPQLPTATPSRGLTFAPVSEAKTSKGGGWAELSVGVAIINDDDTWHKVQVPYWGVSVFTAEGYSYPADTVLVDTGGLLLPPGFVTRGDACPSVYGDSTTIYAKVAENSSGYTVAITEYGDEDLFENAQVIRPQIQFRTSNTEVFDYPLVSTSLPIPVYTIGDIVSLPEAEFTLTGARREGTSLYVDYEFRNLSGGYNMDYRGWHNYLIGDDGFIYNHTSVNCGDFLDLEHNSFDMFAGPAQTGSRTRIFGVPEDVDNLYLVLVVMQLNSGGYTTIGGYVFKVD